MFSTKYPVFLSIALFKSIQKTLIGFSKRFEHTEHRQHFIHLVLTIISQGSTRLQESAQIVAGPVGCILKNLSYFLKSQGWSLGLLTVIHTSFLIKRLPAKLYVLLDMTALVKTGKHFECLGQVHDGRDNQVKPGYNLLMSLAVSQADPQDRFILNHSLISNKESDWQGENTAIIQHIQELVSVYKKAKISLKDPIHIGNRGFNRQYIIKSFIQSQLEFVIRANDKKVVLKNETETFLYQLTPGVYHHVYLKAWDMYLNVVVTQGREKEDAIGEETLVLLTNVPVRYLSQKQGKEIYQQRWRIETCFKTLKEDYDLEGFRVRSWIAIQRLVSLTLLAFNVNQYYMRVWRERVKGMVRKKKSRIFDSFYSLRKYIQKMLYFGFTPDFLQELRENTMDSG